MNSGDSQETQILKAKRLIGPLMYNKMLCRTLLQNLNHITLNMKHCQLHLYLSSYPGNRDILCNKDLLFSTLVRD